MRLILGKRRWNLGGKRMEGRRQNLPYLIPLISSCRTVKVIGKTQTHDEKKGGEIESVLKVLHEET